MTAPTEIREQLAQRLDIDETAPTDDGKLDDLRARLRAVSVEFVAGNADAVAEVEQIETEIRELERLANLRELASTEAANRTRIEAEAEAEARRQELLRQQGEHEAARAKALARFEKQLAGMVASARVALIENAEGSVLQGQIEPGSGLSYRRLNMEIESRIVRVVHDALGEFHVQPGTVFGDTGRTPLA